MTGPAVPRLADVLPGALRVGTGTRVLILGRPVAAAAVCAFVLARGWWVFGGVAVSVVFVCTAVALHDLVHRNLGLGRRVNGLLLGVFGVVLLNSGHAIAATHLEHHRVYPNPGDPEALPERWPAWRVVAAGPFYRFGLWRWTWEHRPRHRAALAVEVAAFGAVWVTGLALATVCGRPGVLAYIVIVEGGTAMFPVVSELLVHDRSAPDAFGQLRSTRHWSGRVLLGMQLHLEHHLYPRVPATRLHQLATALAPSLAPGRHERPAFEPFGQGHPGEPTSRPERGYRRSRVELSRGRAAGLAAAIAVAAVTAGPDASATPADDPSVLEPSETAAAVEAGPLQALPAAIGLPADLADVPGDLAHFSAAVRPAVTDITITVLVDQAPPDAAATAGARLTASGWNVEPAATAAAGGVSLTAWRDIDGIDDGNLDGIGEQSLLIDVQAQPGGRTSIDYLYTDLLDPASSTVADAALFAGIEEAAFDPALTLESASLTATVDALTRTDVFGTRTLTRGVTFTADYTAPLADSQRLADALTDLCTRPGYQCHGPVDRPAGGHATVEVRLPSGGQGQLTVLGLPELGITTVTFFLSFGLDSGLPIPTAAEPEAPTPTLPATTMGDDDPNPATPAKPTTAWPTAPARRSTPSGLIAAAAVALLAGLTAAALRRRRPDTNTAAPEPGAERAAVQNPLEELVAHLRATRSGAEPVLVQIAADRIEVLLSGPAQRPAGWHEEGEHVWVLDTTPSSEADMTGSLPLLVPLGDPDDHGQLYLNLATAPVFTIHGPSRPARLLVDSITAHLVHSDVAVFTMRADAVAEPAKEADWTHLEDHLAGTTQPLTPQRPLVIVTDTRPPPPLARLLGHQPAGSVCELTTDVRGGGVNIECSTDEIHIPSLGLTVAVTAPDSAATRDTVSTIGDGPDSDLLAGEVETPPPADATIDDPDAPPEVVIRLLGDIRIDAPNPVTGKETAVLAYLATHPEPSVNRVLAGIWPAGTGSRKRLLNIMSGLRSTLGRERLPEATDGRYRLGPGLTSDLTLFDQLLQRAGTELPADAAATLRQAFELVTSPPLTYSDTDAAAYTWIDLEHLVAYWELRIATTAIAAVDLHLDLRLTAEAIELASRALRAVPGHAGLLEALARAHDANGDPRASERVHATLQVALDRRHPARAEPEALPELEQAGKAG